MAYILKQDQTEKINDILKQLKDEDKVIFSNKIESLTTYNNAEDRINKLINKDIDEIKKVLSVLKTRKKTITKELKDLIKQINVLKTSELIIIKNKIDTLIENRNKDKEIMKQQIKQQIENLKQQLKDLK